MAKILEVSASYMQTVDYGDYVDGERINVGAVRGYSRLNLRVPIPEGADPRGLDVVVEQDLICIKLGDWGALYRPRFPLDADNAAERTAKVLRRGPGVSFRTACSFYLELVVPLLRDEAQALMDARRQLEEATRVRGAEEPVADSCLEDVEAPVPLAEPRDTGTATVMVDDGDCGADPASLKTEPLTEIRPGTSQPVVELATDGSMALQSLKKLAVGWQKNTNQGKLVDKAAQHKKLEDIYAQFTSKTAGAGEDVSFEFQGFVFRLANPSLSAAYRPGQH